MIRHVTRAKARFKEITQAFKSQLVEELDGEHPKSLKSSLWLTERQIEPSTHHRNRNGEPVLRLTQEQTFCVTGYQSERIQKIFLNSDIDFHHFYFEGSLNRNEGSDELNQRFLRGAGDRPPRRFSEWCQRPELTAFDEVQVVTSGSCFSSLPRFRSDQEPLKYFAVSGNASEHSFRSKHC